MSLERFMELRRMFPKNSLPGNQPAAAPKPKEVMHEKTGRGRIAACEASFDLASDPDPRLERLGGSRPINGLGRLPENCGFQYLQLPPAP